jgi:hypothetical protein
MRRIFHLCIFPRSLWTEFRTSLSIKETAGGNNSTRVLSPLYPGVRYLRVPNVIARETGAEVVIMPSSVEGAKGVGDYFLLFDPDLALLSRAFQSKP